MSVIDQTSKELSIARVALHKFGGTFAEFQSHSLLFTEQWKELFDSLTTAHNSLEYDLRNHQEEVELRKKRLDLEETSLSERIRGVEIREKQVKYWFKMLCSKKRGIDERFGAVEEREKRFPEGFERVRGIDELTKREEAFCEKEGKLKVRESELEELSEELELKEVELKKRILEVEQKEVNFEEKWKEFEMIKSRTNEYYDMVKLLEKEMIVKAKTLVSEEERLGLRGKEMDERDQVLEAKEKRIEELSEVLGAREKRIKEREDGVELKEKRIAECDGVLEAREKQVEEREGDMELKDKELESRQRWLESFEKDVDKQWKVLELEKRSCKSLRVVEERGNVVEKLSRVAEECGKVFRRCEEALCLTDEETRACCERGKELKENVAEKRKCEKTCCEGEKELKANAEETGLRETILGDKGEPLKVRQTELNNEVKLIEDEMNERSAVLEENKVGNTMHPDELKEKEMNEKRGILVLEQKLLGLGGELGKEQKKGLESKEKELDEQSRELISERQSGDNGHCHSSFSKIDGETIQSLCRNIDAYGIRSYLITHFQKNQMNELHEMLMDGLRCSPDPAKLVLLVFQSFHCEFSEKNLSIANKNTCIFLLEQFMKLSIPIARDVQKRAKHLASSFWNLLKRPGANTVENNFGFLQFLVAFNLTILYHPHDLLSLFGHFYSGQDVYRHEQQASLCRALGLSNRIPGVIRNLIERKKLITAVKYACVFKLENEFPLVPLLEAYLDSTKKRVKEKLREGTFKSKMQAENMELNFLQDVINCIATFELESIFPPDSLISRMTDLELEKEARNPIASKGFNKRSAVSGSCSAASPQKRPRCG